MSPTRIFSSANLSSGLSLELGEVQSRYLTRALRLTVGDGITLFDGRGGEYEATLAAAGKKSATVEIGVFHDRKSESSLRIHVVQGVSKGDRMDTVVQKATELGATSITPIVTDFSVVRFDEKRSSSRVEHWAKVAQSACEQCGRNVVPHIASPISMLNWLGDEPRRGALILKPGATTPMTEASIDENELCLLIGPEGGFSPAEYERAVAAEMVPVSLGPRILRTETAAIAAISAAQSKWGDL
jgi:16S rRNA (uracil1498-N3)-methyltransferase